MKNKIFIIVFSFLSACSTFSERASYPMVALEEIPVLENILKSVEIKPTRLTFSITGAWAINTQTMAVFKKSIIPCSMMYLKLKPVYAKPKLCIIIQNYDGDETGTDIVKAFIRAYNQTHNTTFNLMKDVKIEYGIYTDYLIPLHTEGYYISGILLEIALSQRKR